MAGDRTEEPAHGAAVDVDQIYEYVELIQDELARPDEVVLGCLLADGFDPATLSYIREIDVPIVLQTLVAIGFHDARFAERGDRRLVSPRFRAMQPGPGLDVFAGDVALEMAEGCGGG